MRNGTYRMLHSYTMLLYPRESPAAWESPGKKGAEREKGVQDGRMGGRETEKKRNDR